MNTYIMYYIYIHYIHIDIVHPIFIPWHTVRPRQDVTGEFFRVRLAPASFYLREGSSAIAEGWIRHAPWLKAMGKVIET